MYLLSLYLYFFLLLKICLMPLGMPTLQGQCTTKVS